MGVKRINHKGRNGKAGRFAALPHRVLKSRAYGSLDTVARCALVELCMVENGSNNGSLWMSVRDMADRLGLSDCKAVTRAFADIMDRRFAAITKDAHFSVKASETSRARCWRLEWLVWPDGPRGKRAPCWDFEQWELPAGATTQERAAIRRANKRDVAMSKWQKAKSENRLPVVDFTTTAVDAGPNEALAVEDSSTGKTEKHAFPPILVVEESSTHTDVTRGRCWAAGMDWAKARPETIAGRISPVSLAA